MKAGWSAKRCVSVFLLIVFPAGAVAQTCYTPPRPFVPTDPQDVQEYRDLIGHDFESYITEIQSYFKCLEKERARAFQEAREVTEEYGRFLEIVRE